MTKFNKNYSINISAKLKYLGENRSIHLPYKKKFIEFKNKYEKQIIKKNFKNLIIKFSKKIGLIKLRYFKMGKLNPSYLLGFNELIIFAFYLFNKKRYTKFIDIGGNIGLHAIFFDKLNIKVQSFEPDVLNFNEFKKNLKRNQCKNVRVNNSAIFNKDGFKNFVRVCDNTTGSHIQGKKMNPYGKLEIFKVKTENINKYLRKKCLVKIDAEGSEFDILKSIKKDYFKSVDFILEINNLKNAKEILKISKKYKFNIFSQKISWNLVKNIKDLPKHHTEGSIYISPDKEMSW